MDCKELLRTNPELYREISEQVKEMMREPLNKAINDAWLEGCAKGIVKGASLPKKSYTQAEMMPENMEELIDERIGGVDYSTKEVLVLLNNPRRYDVDFRINEHGIGFRWNKYKDAQIHSWQPICMDTENVSRETILNH